MAAPEQKLTSPATLVIDAVLVIGFFLYMYSVLHGHVQSHDKAMIMLWGGLTSALMAALFWLALQLQRQLRAEAKNK